MNPPPDPTLDTMPSAAADPLADAAVCWRAADAGAPPRDFAPTGAFSLAVEFRGQWRPEGSALVSLPGVFEIAIQPEASPADVTFRLTTDTGRSALRAPLHLVAAASAHSVVVRFTGHRIDLFVDGLLLHQHVTAAAGTPASAGGSLRLGGDCVPERGIAVIAFAAWTRALTDAEITALCGGREAVDRARAEKVRRQRAAFERARRLAARDPQRPRFHFLPPAYWMNDPNGLISWQGEFHLFYQHNPHGAYWGTMHWGHALTQDLVHWKHLPIALAPDPDGPDRDGCFSGCAIEADGRPLIFYTGVYPERQCRAVGSPDLVTWSKDAANPIIAAPPPGLEAAGFRDPWVWREDGEWRMIVGSGACGHGGLLPMYRSDDLKTWEHIGALCEGDGAHSGRVWECPVFFRADAERHVLIVSPDPLGQVLCFVGTYDGRRFTPRTETLLDLGGEFYAPQVQLDPRGRRVALGWIREARSDRAQWRSGWSGCLSLPRLITVDEQGHPRMEPIPELSTLRRRRWQRGPAPIGGSFGDALADVRGDQLEIKLSILRGGAERVALRVRATPDGQERTDIVFDWGSKRLTLDRERSSLDPEVHRAERGGQLALDEGEALSLHVFVDHSVIEVFAGGRACLTGRVYPTRADATAVDLLAEGGSATLLGLDVWQIASIWEDEPV